MLTILGAGLRFYRLEHPALWGDEVATWGRVTGTFAQLMERLKEEGFVPGHYVLYWALGKYVPLDPWYMRVIPAVAGSLMVPAGYFLARQVLGRGASLVAALFFAVSAYGLTYSRDAKMYMHTWLLAALCLACLMHWVRTRRAWSLWGWILAGAAASTLHATALIVLAVVPGIVLLHRSHGHRWLRWRDPLYIVVGLVLIAAFPWWYYRVYNSYIARTGIATVSTAADEEIDADDRKWRNSGITWVEAFNRGIGPWELTLNSATGYLIGLQWPREAIDPRGFEEDGVPPWFLPLCVWVMTPLVLLLVAGAWPRGGGAGGGEAVGAVSVRGPPQPWWITLTWLGLWLVVPTYGVYYCRSFEDFVPPWHAVVVAHRALQGQWLAVSAAAVLVGAVLAWRPRLAGWVRFAGLAWLAATLGLAMARGGSYWLHEWGGLLGEPWLLWPMAAVLPAVLWHDAGPTVRERALRAGQLAIPVAVVLAACVVCYVLMQRSLAEHQAKGLVWQSIWMPRYLGIVYPAVIVATAALLLRLPTWPLRTLAIVAFVAVNLAQGLARIEVGTEPPYAQVAQDLWETYTTHKATTVAVNLEDADGEEGRDWTRQWIMDYYMYAESGWVPAPELRKASPRRVLHYRVNVDMDRIRRGLERRPELSRIILWERFNGLIPAPAGDPVLDALSGQLQRTDERLYRTHQFWTWRPGDTYRRRVYERVTDAVAPVSVQ